MTGWVFKCPECGADVASGWGDPICPIPTCGALMNILYSPPVTQEDLDRMMRQVEDILRSDKDGHV